MQTTLEIQFENKLCNKSVFVCFITQTKLEVKFANKLRNESVFVLLLEGVPLLVGPPVGEVLGAFEPASRWSLLVRKVALGRSVSLSCPRDLKNKN